MSFLVGAMKRNSSGTPHYIETPDSGLYSRRTGRDPMVASHGDERVASPLSQRAGFKELEQALNDRNMKLTLV